MCREIFPYSDKYFLLTSGNAAKNPEYGTSASYAFTIKRSIRICLAGSIAGNQRLSTTGRVMCRIGACVTPNVNEEQENIASSQGEADEGG